MNVYTQDEIDLVKSILQDVVQNSTPKEFPQLYRRGYQDGVYAALQLLRNIDLFVPRKS